MERHCRIHGNYGFFLGSSGGCPSCKSDRASAKRDRDRARDDAKRDRERAREEARARQLENQRNHEQANRDRERARETAQSRHRDNNQRRETRPQPVYQLSADDKFAIWQQRQIAERALAESQIKQAQEKKNQEERELAEKERLEREAKAEIERQAEEVEKQSEKRSLFEKSEVSMFTRGIERLEHKVRINQEEKIELWRICLGILLALWWSFVAFCWAGAVTGSVIYAWVGGGISLFIFFLAFYLDR